MSTPAVEPVLRPTERQEALLHAALGDAGPALAAWRRWRSLVDFDDIEMPEFRLVPLAYANLGEAIAGDPVYGRAAGLYRHAWSRNQVLFNRAEGAISTLAAAGIETMLLKGSALGLLHYPNPGERPMGDVDVLVRPARAREAVKALGRNGWSNPHDLEHAMVRLQSADLSNSSGGAVDLHWFSLWASTNDDPLWDAARPVSIGSTETLAPAATDLLLVVCVHGSSRQSEAPIRWIADAMTIARTAEIDWDRLLAESIRRNFTVTMASSLAYLRDEFALEIPAEVLRELAAHPAPRWERTEYRVQTAKMTQVRALRVLGVRHRRMRRLRDEAPWHPGFVGYAQSFWGLDSAWQLPIHAARKTLRSSSVRSR